ncbi:MAG: 2-phospho-L-lactate guanylyltransferase [Actinomycetota bacterium]
MRIVAIPVKSLDRCKGRLAPVLSPLERAALTLAMLEDVLDACAEHAGWETWVVSPDESVLEVAARRRVKPVIEESGPLATAIAQVERLAKERSADALAILPGDLPTLTGDALGRALHTLGSVVLAPSRDGRGTSLLLRRPPRCIRARFGPDSLARHRALAEERGLPVAIVREPTLAFDLDVPADLRALLTAPDGGRARRAVAEMQVEERLARLA